ncbi:MAG: C40 family peptidase [candidate division Zixibacteria bacterium]|nr:C40 family peptidase [candidate division Zixibacteria bacterium]
MKSARAIRNVVDLSREPEFHSERVSQILYGETVTLTETRNDYSRVEMEDGYCGWARTNAFSDISSETSMGGDSNKLHRVVANSVALVDESGHPVRPYFLLYGSYLQLNSGRKVSNSTRVKLECAPGAYVVFSEDDFIPADNSQSAKNPGQSIVGTALRFLGAPYLWGGRSPLGFDCSGLVQIIFSMHGISIPRDSAAQREHGREVLRDELQSGDLVFSDGHVVISMGAGAGGDEFIHASLGEGGVAINSYNKSRPDYREDLDRDYIIAKRFA